MGLSRRRCGSALRRRRVSTARVERNNLVGGNCKNSVASARPFGRYLEDHRALRRDPVERPILHDPPDLAEMDEEDQAKEIYTWAGLALYYAQVFEQGVIHAMYAARVVDGSLAGQFQSADEFHALVDRLMLGKLLNALREHFPLRETSRSTA
jgi:hypothetical protein